MEGWTLPKLVLPGDEAWYTIDPSALFFSGTTV